MSAKKLYKKIYKSLEDKTDAQKMSVEPILKRLDKLEVIINQLIFDTLTAYNNELLKILVSCNFISPKDYDLRTRL